MKIGVISDIHDHIWNLAKALKALEGAEVLICCGDLCSPFVMDQLGKGFAGPTHIVFGNNDGDRYRLTLKASHYAQIKLHGETAELTLDGQRIGVHHFDDVAARMASSGAYDVVCFGHNHRYEVRHQDRTLVINPGEVMGGLSEGQISSFVIYDTTSREVEKWEL